MAHAGEHKYDPNLQCKCENSSKSEYFFGEEHLGFVCLSCWKEWLLGEFVQTTEEEEVHHGGKTYFCPVSRSAALKEDSRFQATPSREKIVPDYAAESLKRGDHIMWHYQLYWHHAIVEEVNGTIVTVIEYNSKGKIVRSNRDVKKKKEPPYLVVYNEEVRHFNPVELTLARANSLLGQEGYDLLEKNCENFATFCKTGVSSNQQKSWFIKKITDILKTLGVTNAERCITVLLAEFLEADLKASGAVKIGSEAIGAGALIAFEGFKCIVDLREMYKRRKEAPKDGKLGYSRKDFVEDVVTRISSALFSTTLGVVGGLGTIVIPGLGPVAGFVKSVLCGSVGITVGQTVGELIGPHIGRAIASLITNDRPVSLQELKPGDHIVRYGNPFHPRCHCIVLDKSVENGEMMVIRFKQATGLVYEELIYDEQDPPLQICYPENVEKYSPEEIVDRAVDALESYDKKYNIFTNNCKHFANSIILKPKKGTTKTETNDDELLDSFVVV